MQESREDCARPLDGKQIGTLDALGGRSRAADEQCGPGGALRAGRTHLASTGGRAGGAGGRRWVAI